MAIPKGFGSVEDLIKRFNEARERWELFRSLHQEAFDFANPQRETFRLRSPGQRKNRHVFDSTAVLGLEQFASRIQSSIVPSWQQWMNLKAGDEIPEEEQDKVNNLLEDVTDTFFSHLNHSNFSTEISPALSDLGIGTGAIQIEEGEFNKGEIFKFSNVPLAELYPEMPPGGAIESVWRKQKVEARHLLRVWPGARLPEQLKTMAEKQPNRKVDILNGMLFNSEDGKYWQIVIHEPSKSSIFEQDFNSKRLIVFRWHVVPGEVFGRGPIIQMLPDIRTVNKVKQFILENAALQMAGVYTGVDDGVFNPHTVRIAPGSIIPVKSNNSQNPTLQPLNRSGDLGLGNFVLEDLQAGIRRALFVDPLGEITDPVRSATEVMIRQQEMLKNAGASIGRLKSELVEPLVAAGIDILQSLGKIAPIKVDGKEVTIKQSSPLAKAEDLEDFQNSQMWFANIAQLPQEIVAGAVKVEELPRYWQQKLGIPADLIRTDEERNMLAQQIQAAAQQQLESGGAL